jgi:diguanylate cyclase (GGDEF)-like protein
MPRIRVAFRLSWWVILLCLSWAVLEARAQAVLSGQAEALDLWPQVRVLADPARTLSLEQALASREKFAPPRGAYATLGMDKEVVWLRVPVTVSQGGDGAWILDMDYALLDRVDVYAVRDGKVVRHETVGNGQPFASRPLRGRAHSVPLEFTAGGAYELLLRVDTPGAKILPLSLSRLPAFHARALLEQLIQGALAALGLVLLLYSLAQWASLREHLYLKYALLVLCSVIFSVHFFGIGEMYVWTDRDWEGRHLAGVSALLAAAATALFVEDALAGDLNPWLRRGLRAVAGVHVIATIAYAANVIDLRAVAVLMSTTGLAPALMGLPGAVAKARRGDTVGWWFIIAWLGYFIASAIMVGVVRGKIDAGFWTMHSFQIGATLDMLVFMRIAVLRSAARHREARQAALERDTLHTLAHSDPLTGLLNRRGLEDILSGALARATPEHILALYVLDLDGFKPVNDQFGHDVGDALLRVVAQRLRSSMRAGDGVARLGGDEFVVMAEGLKHAEQAAELGRKLLDAFRTPFALKQHTCSVRATIGYAMAPTDATDARALIKAADAAMYTGKQEGKDRVLRVAG